MSEQWSIDVSAGGSMGAHDLIKRGDKYVGHLYEADSKDVEFIIAACNEKEQRDETP